MQISEKRVKLYIGGMTCVNCQNKIEKELRHTEGVISAGVSYNNGTADIVYDGSIISQNKIKAVIEKLGYEVLPEKGRQSSNVWKVIDTLIIIVFLYIMLQSLGILNLLAPGQTADTQMGYGMVFVIGLITSVHCIAMCGGINLSQCIPQTGQEKEDDGHKPAMFGPALAYNLGRVLSYTAIGFVLGLIGFLMGGDTEVGFSVFMQGVLKIIAGLLMVVMGINMLGLFPWLFKFTIRMPRSLAQKIGKKKAGNRRPFLVGILNGFMPCGPLQSMWIVALAAGNPFAGALSMFLFALGTVPLMLGLGSIVSALGRKFSEKVMTVGAVLVVVLGLAMLSQGGALSGLLPDDLLLGLIIAFSIAGVMLSIPVKKMVWKNVLKTASLVIVIGAYALWRVQGAWVQNQPVSGTEAEVVDGVQIINSTLTNGRYPNITVQAGVPVKWVIDAPEGSLNSCNYKIIIQDYNIEYTFSIGENIIEFTPTESGTIHYSCWMGMIHGNIFVVDESEGDVSASEGEVNVPVPAGYEIPAETIAYASRSLDNNGNEIQEISMEVTDEGFSPAVIVVQSGLPTIWSIDNKMENVSGNYLQVPYYSTQLPLGEGVNSLSFYPQESFDASIADNKFYCYVKVVDDLDTVDEDAVREEVSSFETLIYPAEIYESQGGSCCSY